MFVHQLTKDWQFAGIWKYASGTAYTLGYGYNSQGKNVNITGSPDFGGNVVLSGNPGSGCSSNPLAQFNVSVVKGPTLRQRWHGFAPQQHARLSHR